MRFIFQLVVTVVCICVSQAVISADKPKTGSIHGQVNFCGKGGLEGMQVYIPGLPFVVITGSGGTFQLSNLPEGKYDLHYRLDGRLLNRNPGIYVSSDSITNLSVISFCDRAVVESTSVSSEPVAMPAEKACAADSSDPSCQDVDGDGVVAAQDCDDRNVRVYPGAVELCDGIDNNCNGQVDENASVMVFNGLGVCQAGKVAVKSCKEGFSDCDGDAANGCEVDINNDAEHCGACGEECTPTEVCIAGGCE
jgi:hypothetical protein